ncbi:MAG TPA: tripartite tricarboxylate transporter substrate binding protein [Burkholderiaceae bacterium]|nr:tripartite tricarboxylate transporter substrate binding protein [Burkholderiaceae bacterium]
MGNRIAKALVLGAAVLGISAPLAAAQAQANWPERAVKIIVPYPPGGTADVLGRLMAERLTETLKQSVIVENRPGAGGAIGAAAVARAAPDGYTLLMATIASHSIIPAIGTVPYDPIADFQPVVNVADTPNVLLVNVDTPYKSLADILAAARAKPGAITFGSTSLGGSPHMSGELLKSMAGVDLLHVPYKGGGPMLTDLIGGQVQLGFDNLPSSMPHIRSGKVRPIAVTTPERWPDAPEIPTIAEAGVPGYEVAAWFGILAPAGTPKPVVELLHRSSAEILKEPAFEKRLLELGAKPSGITPEQFSAMLERELGKWREVAAKNGLKL